LCKQQPALIRDVIAETVSIGVYNIERIVEAVRLWNKEGSWSVGGELLAEISTKLPNHLREQLFGKLGGWCEEAMKSKKLEHGLVGKLARLFFSADYSSDKFSIHSDDSNDLRMQALNHPLGQVASGLLDSCFPERINKGNGIPEPYKALFTDICHSANLAAKNAKLILASRTIALYYADELWTREHLVPLGSWENDPTEANAFWQGYLWQNSLHVPLLADMKGNIFATFDHLDELVSRLKNP